MAIHAVSLEEVQRTLKTYGSYRPPQIVDLKARIEAATKAAEIEAARTGIIDQGVIDMIVQMKLQLDRLYVQWTKGELKGSLVHRP